MTIEQNMKYLQIKFDPNPQIRQTLGLTVKQ